MWRSADAYHSRQGQSASPSAARPGDPLGRSGPQRRAGTSACASCYPSEPEMVPATGPTPYARPGWPKAKTARFVDGSAAGLVLGLWWISLLAYTDDAHIASSTRLPIIGPTLSCIQGVITLRDHEPTHAAVGISTQICSVRSRELMHTKE